MSCRTGKNCRSGTAVRKRKRFGCAGTAVSGRCVGEKEDCAGGEAEAEESGGIGVTSGEGGIGFPEPGPITAEEETGEPVPVESLCQVVFLGMHDSLDPQTTDPRYARYMQNVYSLDSRMGTRIVGRPGFVQTGTQLGGAGARRVQGIYQFTKINGTEYTVAIVGGKFYTYNWGTDTWTEDTPGAATISTTATCYFTTFADVLVVSDGTNTPWKWDGTNDTVLSNAPVIYGQPVVYYAKLFGIKNTERSTIVWSEENDPTTGYEAGGYNNAWTLGQTEQEPLFVLIPSNEALFYLRARSIGAIRGAVNDDFINSATREGISTSIGSKSPNGIAIGQETACFMDSDNQVHTLNITSGNLDTNIWPKLRETISGWDETQTGDSRAVYDPTTGLFLVGAVADGGTECNRYVAIDSETYEVQGVWTGWTSTAMAVVKNASGQPVIMHGTENGYIYVHGLPSGSTWNDQNNATDGGTAAIAHEVKGSILGSSMFQEKRFHRWDVLIWLETANSSSLSLSYRTQRGTATAQTKSASLASYPNEYHISVGLLGAGRWIEPRITHSSGSERFGLERWCVQATPYSVEPDVP